MTKFMFALITMMLSAIALHAETPRHLLDLRQLQENVLPQDTSYRHHPSVVLWKGYSGATAFVSHTDCSGLVNALLHHSYLVDENSMRAWLGHRRPKAKDYYRAIKEQKNFAHIVRIQDVLPGDIIAIKFLPWAEDKARDTGHMMVVDDRPTIIGKRTIDGQELIEWSVEVIDSSHGHGKKDTRYRHERFWPGLGKGSAALYTDIQGDIIGYTWSTAEKSILYDRQQRPLVVGRLNFPPDSDR